MNYRMCLWAPALLLFCGCNDNEQPPTQADRVGVGAVCESNADCVEPDVDAGDAPAPVCLKQFKGGYCGLEGCTEDEACPEGAVCVVHTDGTNYCFRRCLNQKTECNENRPPSVAANCSANITFVELTTTGRTCVPPSGQ